MINCGRFILITIATIHLEVTIEEFNSNNHSIWPSLLMYLYYREGSRGSLKLNILVEPGHKCSFV